MPWKLNERVIRPGRPFTHAGVQHPANWMIWSDDEKAAMGITFEADPAPYDNRFYWDANTPKALDDVNEVDSDGNAIIDPDTNQQLVTKGLKSVWKAKIKQQAAALLAETDWYIVREAETNTDAPQSVLTYRSNVRAKSGTIETAIDNAADHAAFMALFDVPVDSDGNPTGNAPIADWPDAL